MKKKLLLSSVAALTLFAAYNAANAEEAKPLYGNLGEELPAPAEKELDAFKIEKAQTEKERLEEATNYKARQEKAIALREANTELKAAKEQEANAKSVFEKAQKAYDLAVEKLTEAMNTQYDASVEKDRLNEVLVTIKDRLENDEKALPTKEKELKDTKDLQKQKADELEKQEAKLESLRNQKPVSGAPADEVASFKLKLTAAELEVSRAKQDKVLVDKAVEQVEKEVKDLKDAIKKNTAKRDALKTKIDQLAKVVGDEAEDKPNSGVVRGVLVQTLQEEADERYYELGQASSQRIFSTSLRKAAEEKYNKALEDAQAEYKKQGVEFVLADVLAVAEPTGTYVTKFGWNQDKDGNWVYLKDSEGTKATGWVNDNGSWYYLGQDGVMKKWWVQVEGTWYFLNGTGAMQTGWLQDNGTWYYLEASGAMKANQWFEVDGKWYHVNASGALSVNTTVDGYNVNENGEWV